MSRLNLAKITTMESDISFGDFLKEKRQAKGWSKWKLYQESGVSYAHISLLETGEKNPPKPITLKKLSDSLGIPYEDLLDKAGYLNDIGDIETAIKKRFGPLFNDEQVKLLANKDITRILNYCSQVSPDSIKVIADTVEAVVKGLK